VEAVLGIAYPPPRLSRDLASSPRADRTFAPTKTTPRTTSEVVKAPLATTTQTPPLMAYNGIIIVIDVDVDVRWMRRRRPPRPPPLAFRLSCRLWRRRRRHRRAAWLRGCTATWPAGHRTWTTRMTTRWGCTSLIQLTHSLKALGFIPCDFLVSQKLLSNSTCTAITRVASWASSGGARWAPRARRGPAPPTARRGWCWVPITSSRLWRRRRGSNGRGSAGASRGRARGEKALLRRRGRRWRRLPRRRRRRRRRARS
jgi:hypothetical protein